MKLSVKHWLIEQKLFLVIAIGIFVLFSWFSLLNHVSLKTRIDDLGNISQALWNSSQGRLMEYSNTSNQEILFHNRLAGHANFIYLFLIPFYVVWPDPRGLLIFQSLMVALAATPLYLLGKRLFSKNSPFIWLAPIAFWLHPALHDALLYDIHAIVVGLPLLTGSLYCLLTRRDKAFLVMAGLLLLVKEDMPLLVAMMGIYQVIVQKRYKLGVAIMGISLAYFLVITTQVMPALQQTSSQETLISTRYGDYGETPLEIVGYFLIHPQVLFQIILEKNVVGYLFVLLIGFAGLSVLHPVSLVAVPTLAINFLSNNWITYQIFGYYYTAPLIAIGAVGFVQGLKKITQTYWITLKPNVLFLVILGLVCGYSFWLSPLPYSRVSSWSEFQPDSRLDQIQHLRSLIPQEASLSIQNNLGPYFINRRNIVRFPYRLDQSQYVLIDMTDPYPIARDYPRQRNFPHIVQLFPQEYLDAVQPLFLEDDFGVIYQYQGFFLFERGADPELNNQAFVDFVSRAKDQFKPYENYLEIKYPQVL